MHVDGGLAGFLAKCLCNSQKKDQVWTIDIHPLLVWMESFLKLQQCLGIIASIQSDYENK